MQCMVLSTDHTLQKEIKGQVYLGRFLGPRACGLHHWEANELRRSSIGIEIEIDHLVYTQRRSSRDLPLPYVSVRSTIEQIVYRERAIES